MTKRMLINATQSEELRVALVDGKWLYDLDIESARKEQKKSNIYKGKITRIEQSLEAAFVDYGSERHGFLPFREIAQEYFFNNNGNGNNGGNNDVQQHNSNKQVIKKSLKVGQEVIVQVEKEERGTKGAALTTYLAIAGCYLVLMPNNPRAGGISRRIEGEERAELREILSELKIPDDMGVIIRTDGAGRQLGDLQWDLDILVQQWGAIKKAASAQKAPFLIYQESNLVVRAIRDHLRQDIDEILIDSPKVFENACAHIKIMRPDFINKVKLYNDTVPLFSKFQVESQIELAFRKEVPLPSGGCIVIDHTEAMIAIDINSAKATKGGDIEETALQTNLEASDEIGRQAKIRDLSGLIVIDYIDMVMVKNKREVEQRLKDAFARDRARVQIGKISKFGLLEMSRQRLRPALNESREIPCPQCSGQGLVRSIEALSLNVIRLIEEEAIKEDTESVYAELPIEIATYLINEKRLSITNIENRHHIHVIIIPNKYMLHPNFEIKRIKHNEVSSNKQLATYSLVNNPEQQILKDISLRDNKAISSEQPAVKQMTQVANTVIMDSTSNNKSSFNIIKRIWSSIIGQDNCNNVDVDKSSAIEPVQLVDNIEKQRPFRKPYYRKHIKHGIRSHIHGNKKIKTAATNKDGGVRKRNHKLESNRHRGRYNKDKIQDEQSIVNHANKSVDNSD